MSAKKWVSVWGFSSKLRVRWSEHVLCFIWDNEATGPGKLSSLTIPREYHHSSIEEEGQRGKRKRRRRRRRRQGAGREGEMFIVRERKGCVEKCFLLYLSGNWSNLHTCLIESHFPEIFSSCCPHLLQFPLDFDPQVSTSVCIHTTDATCWHVTVLHTTQLQEQIQKITHPYLTHSSNWNRKGTFCLLIATMSHSLEDKEQIVATPAGNNMSLCGEYELQCICCEPAPPACSITACRKFSPKYQAQLFSRVSRAWGYGDRVRSPGRYSFNIKTTNDVMFDASLILVGQIPLSLIISLELARIQLNNNWAGKTFFESFFSNSEIYVFYGRPMPFYCI